MNDPDLTTSPSLESSFYHVCFTVPDLHAAMHELTELLDVHFGQPVHDQLGPWPYSLVFTRETPHIELISSIAGSPWATTTPQFHHLGWWTPCLTLTIEKWATAGRPPLLDGRKHGRKFAYLDAPHSGARIEAVDATQLTAFQNRWAS